MSYWDQAQRNNYQGYLGVQNDIGGQSAGSNMSKAGTTGLMAGGPAGAAIGVAGSFLTQYLANKAADERVRRQAKVDAAQNLAQGEQGQYAQMINALRSSLL